jgi:ribosomal protein S18 acetylase RimI-like enzyme
MTGVIEFRAMQDADTGEVISLWRSCGLTRPRNKPEKDIAFARGKPHSDILVGTIEGKVVASIMIGHDGHRGSFYYVAVDPVHRRRGIGARLIREGERWLKERGVWKVNLLIRQENADVQTFYKQLGYAVNEAMSMGQRLIED